MGWHEAAHVTEPAERTNLKHSARTVGGHLAAGRSNATKAILRCVDVS